MSNEQYKTLIFEGKEYYLVPKEEEAQSLPKIKKMAVVIGHTSSAKGSKSPFMNTYEFDFFASRVKNLDPNKYDVFHHNSSIDSYTQRQIDMSNRTRDYGLTVEMHFDSFETPTAHGCHAIYYTTNNLTKQLAFEFAQANEQINGIKARSSVACSNRNQRGGGFIFEQMGNCLLLEWGFGSNQGDSNLMMSDDFDIEGVLDKIHPTVWF